MAQRLVRLAQAGGAKRDADFPEFYLFNVPFHGTDESGVADSHTAQVLNQLLAIIHRLNECGCAYCLIACNTFHSFLSVLRAEFSGEIIDMVSLACDAVVGCKRVAVLSSRTTVRLGLYRDALRARSIEMIETPEGQQAFVDTAIGDAISGDRPERYWKGMHCMVSELKSRGAEKIIGGCTEIPLTLVGHPLGKEFIDGGEVAVTEALRLLA